MKKLLIATTALAAFSVSAPAFAQSSDTTTISATIPLVCTIDAPDGGAVAVSGTTEIGSVSAKCNDPDGFTATLTSLNGGKLTGLDSDNTSTIPYTFTISGATDGTGPQSLAAPKVFPRTPGDQTAIDGFSLPMQIQTTGTNGPAFADKYSDTITFAIVAN
jgi:hypothetical protein